MIYYENVVEIKLLFIQHNDHKTKHKYTPQVPDENNKEAQCIRKGQLRRLGTKSIFGSIVLQGRIL